MFDYSNNQTHQTTMANYITMSLNEIKKYDIVKKTITRELNGSQAAQLLNLSTRQVRRLKMKVKDQGAKGLVHGNRGKPGNRRLPDQERQKIIYLLHQHYADFGPLLASEKLAERHHTNRSKSAVRSIMITEGLWKPHAKKKELHRAWRERKASKGELIQYDGSYEYWFEDRGAKCCLLTSIDDADSEVKAMFDNHEGIEPTFNYWRRYIEYQGKPHAIYVDKFSTYSMNHKLAQENPDTLTQFERAMKELNIGVIHAHSPQAKGRVERLFKTLQDRLIKELRLNDIFTIKEANEFLEQDFLPKFNAKFMVEARIKINLHKQLNKQEKNKLDSIFSRHYERVVNNDFTISHQKHYYQLEKNQPVTICKQDIVTVEERMDKSIHIKLRGKYLNYQLLPQRPQKLNAKEKRLNWIIPKQTTYTPPASHPWRQIARMNYQKRLIQISN
jgi:transposase-like protein